MMAAEGPFVAAVIARLAAPTENLAAFGVAFAIGLAIESPIMMLLAASTTLVVDRQSFLALRRFAHGLNLVLTLVILLLLVPPVSDLVLLQLLDLPPDVARLTDRALVLLVPWPAAIGYRRFRQGLLIRHHLTRWVAYGTVFRLLSMGGTALAVGAWSGLNGAQVGALALSAGVIAEAGVAHLVSRDVVARLPVLDPHAGQERLSIDRILDFYVPLALTSALGISVQPMTTFFLGHSRLALESLAVLPVVNGISFLFRSMAMSYQEAVIALLGERRTYYGRLRRFAVGLAAFTSGGLALFGFGPLAMIWFRDVSGLQPDLAAFALTPTRILILLPALTVVLSVQRGLVVVARRTRMVTAATLTEVAVIAGVLLAGIVWLDLVGATAAAIALVVGRLFGTLMLAPTARTAATRFAGTGPQS